MRLGYFVLLLAALIAAQASYALTEEEWKTKVVKTFSRKLRKDQILNGTHRAAVRLTISKHGTISDVCSVTTVGQPVADVAVEKSVKAIRNVEFVPSELDAPVTLVLYVDGTQSSSRLRFAEKGKLREPVNAVDLICETQIDIADEIRDGDPRTAVQHYDRALQVKPKSVSALQGRGSAYRELKEFHKAVADFSSAVAAEPAEQWNYVQLARTYADMRDNDKALAILSQGFAKAKYKEMLYDERAEIYSSMNNYNEALEDRMKYLFLSKKKYFENEKKFRDKHLSAKYVSESLADSKEAVAGAYYLAGMALSDLHQKEKAVEAYDKAIEFNHKVACYYNNRGLCHFKLGNWNKAATDFNCACIGEPRHALHYTNRGEFFIESGKTKEARSDFKSAIGLATYELVLNPEDPYALRARAGAYLETGEFEKAIADCELALKMDENAYGFLAVLGRAYFGKKNYPEALKMLSKAISKDPLEPSFPFYRSQVYEAMGNSFDSSKDKLVALSLGYIQPPSGASMLVPAHIEDELTK